MRRVFVDTGGFLALLVVEDAHHDRALELFRSASADRWRLITTNAVVVETYSVLLVRSRAKRESAIAFLDMVTYDDYHVERVRRTDEVQAFDLVKRHVDKSYSLCDALSFVVMERLGIREAIAFDRHFRAFGCFTIL